MTIFSDFIETEVRLERDWSKTGARLERDWSETGARLERVSIETQCILNGNLIETQISEIQIRLLTRRYGNQDSNHCIDTLIQQRHG